MAGFRVRLTGLEQGVPVAVRERILSRSAGNRRRHRGTLLCVGVISCCVAYQQAESERHVTFPLLDSMRAPVAAIVLGAWGARTTSRQPVRSAYHNATIPYDVFPVDEVGNCNGCAPERVIEPIISSASLWHFPYTNSATTLRPAAPNQPHSSI